ncbi:UvrD-helicase domain-containing protein [Bacillus cereus]|nr:UvrD-helicase domain-containing protein [Bacillus cereus]
MLQFDEKEYEIVEKILLGNGNFNDLQKEFIELFETKTIIAGPGAGKTTALAAKIVLLLRYLNRIGSKDGLCIITYTNVAVKEINTTLQKIGISSISHPHFIGTIHEFFNKFCVLPYFKKEYEKNNVIFNDSTESDIEYFENFFSSKYPWINQSRFKDFKAALSKRTLNSPLIYNESQDRIDIMDIDNWVKFNSYKNDMLDVRYNRIQQGILQFHDTFFISQLYLLNTYYIDILQRRFKYIFIDEFQDTEIKGMELLKKIFDSENNIMQMIGDPYQTIMYKQPMPEYKKEQVFTLNCTNRFGKEISTPLNEIIPQVNIQALDTKQSFRPVLLLYQDEKEIYTEYHRIIKEYEQKHGSFKACEKGDKVLVWTRKWSSKIKEGVKYVDKKSREFESRNVQLKRLVIEFICKKINDGTQNFNELKNWIGSHQKMGELNSLLLDFLKFGINDEGRMNLKSVINILLYEKGAGRINLNNLLFQKIEDVLKETMEREKTVFETPNDIFTIHSVKGETLRSALVVNFENGPLMNILFHRYGISEDDSYRYTDQNLLYVAMSRVVYLFIFAIHKEKCTDAVREKLQVHWDIREI